MLIGVSFNRLIMPLPVTVSCHLYSTELIKENDNFYIIHVVNEKDTFLNNRSDGDALEYLFDVSKKVGADLSVIRSKDVIKAIGDFAINKNITDIP